MKKKKFYHHLVELDSLYIALEELDLAPHEKDELVDLMEKNIHHVVIDTILSELSEKDKETFLLHLNEDKHDELWELLHKKADQIENKIQTAVEDIRKKLHQDIKEAKKKS